MSSETQRKEAGIARARRGPGRVAAGAALLLGVLLVAAWAMPRVIVLLRAGRERETIAWDEFRGEIEREIADAEALVEQAGEFDAAEALRRARVDGRNGYTHRFLDHPDSAVPTGIDSAAAESGEIARAENAWADEAGYGSDGAGARLVEPNLGGQRRPSLPLEPGEGLRFPVTLPGQPLELMLGVGADGDELAGALEVELRFGGRRETLAPVAPPQVEGWTHCRVALPPWATGEGSVEFRHASGDPAANAGQQSEPGGSIFVAEPLVFGRPQRRLNVIFILEDTLRSDHLSGYGYHRRTSPEKDAFFSGGVVFEHPFSQAPSTLMSVTSMMTSLYPSATGVLRHDDRLSEEVLTLAEILRDQGYATASIVQNPYAGSMSGMDQGFERVSGVRGGGRRLDSGEVYAKKALEFLDDFAGRNIFLYLHILDPHHPYGAAPAFVSSGAERVRTTQDDPLALEGEPVDAPPRSHRLNRFQYGGEIRQNDFHFAEFAKALQERGVLDDTLIVFLSDHGEYFGEDERRVHTPPGFIHVLHVPLMMRHPGLLPEGLRIPEPVELVDVVPTILDLLEIPREPFLLAGDSLVPLIRGEQGAAERWARRVIVSQDGAGGGASFVRGPWHVLSSPSFMSNYDKFETFSGVKLAWTRWRLSGEQIRVFSYVQDRQERRGLPGLARDPRFREELVGLRRDLLDRYAAVNALLRGEPEEPAEIDEETTRLLKRLGYL